MLKYKLLHSINELKPNVKLKVTSVKMGKTYEGRFICYTANDSADFYLDVPGMNKVTCSALRDTVLIEDKPVDETQEDVIESKSLQGKSEAQFHLETYSENFGDLGVVNEKLQRVPRERKHRLVSAMAQIALNAEMTSHDPKTQVGAALICPDTFAILAESVNGFIRGAADEVLPNISPEKHLYMRHAERNLISFCARKGISMENKIVISTHSCCYECARALWDSGVQEVVYKTEHKMTRESFEGKLDLTYTEGNRIPIMAGLDHLNLNAYGLKKMIMKTLSPKEVKEIRGRK